MVLAETVELIEPLVLAEPEPFAFQFHDAKLPPLTFVSAAVPTLSTGSSDVDILCYVARSATTIDAVLLKNFDR